MRTWLVRFRALILLAGGAYVTFGRREPVDPPAAIAVTLPKTDDQVVAPGRAVPVHTVALSFSAVGAITDVLIHLGDRVAAGRPPARLDAAQRRARVAQAQAELAQARAN